MSDPHDKQIGGTHYKEMAIQPSDYIVKNGIGWYEGNAIKYLTRHKAKGQRADLEKAIHYIELAIQHHYGNDLEKFVKELLVTDKIILDSLAKDD